MDHNHAENMKNRIHNIYGENLWRGPGSRADVAKSTRIPIMHYDPRASWLIQEKVRPMHWDPRENWNHNLTVADTVADMMNKDSFKFYDNISRSLPSEGDVYVSEGGKARKHSIKRRKSRMVRKSRNMRKTRKY